MCCLLSGTFVLVTVAFIGNLTENFVLVKYSLRVSLPGGIFAQAEAADSQPLFQIWEQIINWSGNIEVSGNFVWLLMDMADTLDISKAIYCRFNYCMESVGVVA